MRALLSIAVLLIVVAQQSCSPENKLDSSNPKLIWKTLLTDVESVGTTFYGDVQYSGNILLGGMSNGRCLYFLDTETGNIKWKWNDFLNPPKSWGTRWTYQYNDLVFIMVGLDMTCLNLGTGQTTWKRRTVSDFGTYSFGIGNTYYVPAWYYPNGDGTSEGKVISGNLLDGSGEDVLITPEYSRDYIDTNQQKGIIYSCDPVAIGNDQGLLIFFGDPLPDYHINHFIGLYNLTQKRWVYSKKPFLLNVRASMGLPIIKNNKVYNSALRTLQCNDLQTGEMLWTVQQSDLGGSQGWANGKILTTTQDRITHCIDPDTGKELWALTTSGNPGLIKELNGIAYFVGGNSKLFAVDVAAGKILWQFSSPDEKIYKQGYFQDCVSVVPGMNGNKGKVIVPSFVNAFCYQAIR